PAERSFIQSMVLLIGKTCLPVLDPHEALTLASGIAHQAQVPGDPPLMGRKQVITGQSLSREVATQVTIHQINIAESPEIVTRQAIDMDMAERWFDVTEFVSRIRRKIDIQASRYQLAVFTETDALDFDVVWQVLRTTAVTEQQPVDIRIAPAAFEKERHPERPATEIRNNEKNAGARINHRELTTEKRIRDDAIPV